MGQNVSKKNIQRVKELCVLHPKSLGPKFGKLLYDSNLPATAVAEYLEIAIPTLYRWMFHETAMSVEHKEMVRNMAKLMAIGFQKNLLPAEGTTSERYEVLMQVLELGNSLELSQ